MSGPTTLLVHANMVLALVNLALILRLSWRGPRVITHIVTAELPPPSWRRP